MTEGQGGGTPAGWYPDPEGHGERWWNGVSWGELRPAPQRPQQQYPPQHYEQPPYGQQPQHAQPEDPIGHPQGRQQTMRCVHCRWTDFTQAEYVLTPGGTIFDRGIGLANARCLICRRCGFLHWFATG